MPDAEIVSVMPELLFDHKILPAQPLAVKEILVPWHTILSASLEAIVGAFGTVFTVNECTFEARLEQLLCVQVAA